MSATERLSVRCSFEACDSSMVSRVVMATVDQLSATVDVDIALLEALEYPLGEVVRALHPSGISHVDVRIAGVELQLIVSLLEPVDGPLSAMGASSDVIASFFDVRRADSPTQVELTGPLV